MLARILAPHGAKVIWRAFVYGTWHLTAVASNVGVGELELAPTAA